MKIARYMLPVMLIAGGCGHKDTVKVANDGEISSMERTVPVLTGKQPAVILKASAFRMNGDYSDKVAIGVAENGSLTYFPAPSDITESSVPVSLGNGWWLNRQGIGKGYKFTRYTFSEYSRLKEVPTKEELLEAVIPGAEVTEIYTFSIPASEAMDRLEEIKSEL